MLPVDGNPRRRALIATVALCWSCSAPRARSTWTTPTTAPTGSLELVAGRLAHHASRRDTTAAQRALHADLHAPAATGA